MDIIDMIDRMRETNQESKRLAREWDEIYFADPRTPFEKELDEFQKDCQETIESIRPGL